MIDWIRKRIIIEKNAERQPKKKRQRCEGGTRRREEGGERVEGWVGGGRGEREGDQREREGARTIGNNISIPIEPTHTNATVRRGCLLGGKGRSIGGAGRRGTRAFGKSKKYYTLTYWRRIADETGTDQYQ